MKSLHSGGRLSLPLPPFSFTPIERLTDGFCSRWRKNISGDGGGKNWFFTERWGANKGLGEAPKSYTRKEYESATNPIAKRGQGGDFVPFRLPLAGSRDSVPCGVWGNAPTVPRATSIANALNKGAGSEASLPVTLRVRRRASKLLFPQDSVKNRINRRIPHAAVFCTAWGIVLLPIIYSPLVRHHSELHPRRTHTRFRWRFRR